MLGCRVLVCRGFCRVLSCVVGNVDAVSQSVLVCVSPISLIDVLD